MPTGAAKTPEQIAAYFWSLRERELANLVRQTTDAVDEARRAQQVIVATWETARTGESHWQEAVAAAQSAVSKARSRRTSLRRMVYSLKDTIRIRKHLADGLPQRVAEEIEVAERMVQYMDAHGF